MADIRQAKDDIRNAVHSELKGMADDLRANGRILVEKVKSERKAARDEFGDLLGNEIVDSSEVVDSQTKSDGKPVA